MPFCSMKFLAVAILLLSVRPQSVLAQQTPPIPDAATLLKQVVENQHRLDKVRESYTYRESITTEEVDNKGAVKKIEREDAEVFFVNGHEIHRTISKNGKPLEGHDLDKETGHITKEVERAEKTPPDKNLEGQQVIHISRLLSIMQISNPRIEVVKGRAAYVYDFCGKRDADTHGMVEDASKKIAGTIWIDIKDRQVARLDSRFLDNFHIGGGLVANIQKGSSFHFEQALVKDELWLPTAADIHFDARVLLLKGIRQHILVLDRDYEKFHVDTEQKGTILEKQQH
jgi:hypothetical protein